MNDLPQSLQKLTRTLDLHDVVYDIAHQVVVNTAHQDAVNPDPTYAVLRWARMVDQYGEAEAQEAVRSYFRKFAYTEKTRRIMQDITGVEL